eukprot:COSAG02_NODE_148_length_33809_cov_158.369594_32_plen_57_part_00
MPGVLITTHEAARNGKDIICEGVKRSSLSHSAATVRDDGRLPCSDTILAGADLTVY